MHNLASALVSWMWDDGGPGTCVNVSDMNKEIQKTKGIFDAGVLGVLGVLGARRGASASNRSNSRIVDLESSVINGISSVLGRSLGLVFRTETCFFSRSV